MNLKHVALLYVAVDEPHAGDRAAVMHAEPLRTLEALNDRRPRRNLFGALLFTPLVVLADRAPFQHRRRSRFATRIGTQLLRASVST